MLVFHLSVGTGMKKRKWQATCLLVFYSDYLCMQLCHWHGIPVAPLLNIPSLTGTYQNSLVDSWAVTVELWPKYGDTLLMYEDLISWYWYHIISVEWENLALIIWVEMVPGLSVGRKVNGLLQARMGYLSWDKGTFKRRPWGEGRIRMR